MSRRVVAEAIRDASGRRLLLAQRRTPPTLAGLWELPGGKAEPGEDDSQTLRRELAEELGIEVRVGEQLDGSIELGSDAILVARWAVITTGIPTAREHSALRWVDAAELVALEAAGQVVPADTAWVGELTAALARGAADESE